MTKTVNEIAKKQMLTIFGLCWFVYFCANIGRVSYSAVMAAVIAERGFGQMECGMVGTGLYICYGGSQLIAGMLGDRIKPRYMIIVGMLLSAAMNFGMGIVDTSGQMLVLWCVNGMAQSLLWPPIIRIFSDRLHGEYKKKACVNISTTFALGTLVIYFLAGIFLGRIGYRGIFFVTAGLVGVAGIIFFVVFGYLEKNMEVESADETVVKKEKNLSKGQHWITSEIVGILVLLALALVMQGILRDGVTSWVPSYLEGVYHKGVQISILATLVLPVINLGGVYSAELLRKRCGKSEVTVSAILFLVAVAASVIMIFFGEIHIAVAVGAFAVITSCMLGINTMIVNVIPVYFAWTGKISFISGFLNSCVYIGSSIALYGIGAVAEIFGWQMLLFCLSTVAVIGAVLCLMAGKFWKIGVCGKETENNKNLIRM